LSRKKWRKCFHAKIKAEGDFGIIARIAASICLFPLAAILDFALAVARDILTNGLRC